MTCLADMLRAGAERLARTEKEYRETALEARRERRMDDARVLETAAAIGRLGAELMQAMAGAAPKGPAPNPPQAARTHKRRTN